MRNNVAATPFVLFSTWASLVPFEEAAISAARARAHLAVNGIPFKELQMRAFDVGGAEDYAAVFLLDSADAEVARKLARAAGQTTYIEVDAFLAGQRVSLDTGIDGSFVGTLVEVEKRRLTQGEGYLLEQAEKGNRYFVWK